MKSLIKSIVMLMVLTGVIFTGCRVIPINNGSMDCTSGTCVPTCNPGWGDCDGNLANGCESDLSLPNDCVGVSQLTVFAGVPSGFGNVNGTGAKARFSNPSGVAVDGSGNVYVADTYNATIRKVTPAGVVSTLAGKAGQYASVDGTGAEARFRDPYGIAVDGSRNVYVADNYTIRKVTPAGVVSTLAGKDSEDGSADGTGADARFNNPTGLAIDKSGNIYVADTNNSTIRKITPDGVVSTLAGMAGYGNSGSADGMGADARFDRPDGLAVDGSGNIYVADSFNGTIRKITPAGVVSTLAGTAREYGSIDGPGADARFEFPNGVAVDESGNVYVTDGGKNTIRKIKPDGVVSTIAGTAGQRGSADGTGADARFNFPYGIGFDGSGNIYVADSWNDTIRKVTPAGVVSTFAGTARQSGSIDGTGTDARFNGPNGVAVDESGNVYVADDGNNTIRKVTPAGVVSTLAGTAGQHGGTDGTGAEALFNQPSSVAVDGSGNVYVADTYNNSIRKITPAGMVSTLPNDQNTDDRFYRPKGIVVDSSGNVYVANSGKHTIRKITPDGVVSTLAGLHDESGSADGTGSDARFSSPTGLAMDGSGNIYVADTGNSTIRKITPAGVVSTLAGTVGQIGSSDGVGADARFYGPNGIAVDGTGNIYVADSNNYTIRKVTSAGVVNTLVGVPGSEGTLLGPLPASLTSPYGVAFDSTTGSLFIVVDDAVLKANF